LEDIKKMKWLRHVSTIDLYGGTGEPLLHPEFGDIVEYLYNENPKRSLIVTTNGQFLTEGLSDKIAGKIKNINISINAARKETYEFLMNGCSWGRLMKNIECFQKINSKKANPTALSFRYVSNRSNIKELPELASVAKRLKVARVGISHFSVAGIWFSRKEPRLKMTDTLYFHKSLYDEHISKAKEVFRRTGVSFAFPPLFKDATEIYLGARLKKRTVNDRFTCRAPWSTAYINPYEKGRWVSCCCSIGVSHVDLTIFSAKDDFMETWNGKVMQLIRKYVNKKDCILINCDFCRKQDKISPDNAIAQLEMMRDGTMQYYSLLNKELPAWAKEDIDLYEERIMQLKANKADL
jgi:MoaA/NifB/PqqE/SkfB family radical SAM enzyme